MTGSYAPRFFSKGCKHVVTRVTKSNHYSTNLTRAQRFSGPTNTTSNDHTSIILHLPFHPNDPPSYKIQQAWRDTVVSPKYHMPLPHMRNPKSKEKCQIECMIIAYHRLRQSPLTSQPQHQPHDPACLIILPLWLETGDLCVCLVCLVCLVLSVLSA